MLKGAIHVHSTFSDGEFTLRELRETFLADGNRFVCVTDHAQAFDRPKLEAYVRECASLSDDQFLFIPGLEFECYERMHILGYGVTSLIESQDPQEAIRHIERAGGISVIAHPKDSALAWIESFEVCRAASRLGIPSTMAATLRAPRSFSCFIACKNASRRCAPSMVRICIGKNSFGDC